jgi:hypothetical protein
MNTAPQVIDMLSPSAYRNHGLTERFHIAKGGCHGRFKECRRADDQGIPARPVWRKSPQVIL